MTIKCEPEVTLAAAHGYGNDGAPPAETAVIEIEMPIVHAVCRIYAIICSFCKAVSTDKCQGAFDLYKGTACFRAFVPLTDVRVTAERFIGRKEHVTVFLGDRGNAANCHHPFFRFCIVKEIRILIAFEADKFGGLRLIGGLHEGDIDHVHAKSRLTLEGSMAQDMLVLERGSPNVPFLRVTVIQQRRGQIIAPKTASAK